VHAESGRRLLEVRAYHGATPPAPQDFFFETRSHLMSVLASESYLSLRVAEITGTWLECFCYSVFVNS
jgi:hypothetical protein